MRAPRRIFSWASKVIGAVGVVVAVLVLLIPVRVVIPGTGIANEPPQDVSLPHPGEIKKWFFGPGDFVGRDSIVLELSIESLRMELSQVKRDIRVAEAVYIENVASARFVSTRAGSMSSDAASRAVVADVAASSLLAPEDSVMVEILEATADAARSSLSVAVARRDRVRGLLDVGAASRRMMDDAENVVSQAQAEYEEARLKVVQARAPKTIRAAPAIAQAAASESASVWMERSGGADIGFAVARANRARSQVDVLVSQAAEIETRIANPFLRAPGDGVLDVDPTLYATTGTPIEAGAVVFKVYPLGPTRVLAEIPQDGYDAYPVAAAVMVVPTASVRKEIPGVVEHRSLEIHKPDPREMEANASANDGPPVGFFYATIRTREPLVPGSHCVVEAVLYRGPLAGAVMMLADPRGQLRFGW